MKKLTAISFFVLLLYVQYAKQLSYISCTLFYNVAKDCGCEKILQLKVQSGADMPGAVVHKHFHIDDFVKSFTIRSAAGSYAFMQKKKYPYFKSPVLYGVPAGLFHPPNT